MLKIAVLILSIIVVTGCAGLKEAREIKEAPMPAKYIETTERVVVHEGSLWRDKVSFYEDRKARRLNDLVTIIVNETSTASKKASTDSSRDSSANYGLGNFFGSTLTNMNWSQQLPSKLFGFTTPWSGSNFAPYVNSSTNNSQFKGSGATTREGKLSGTITAKVVEVLPNSNLVLESRKEILVNNEKEILVFRGIVNPDNIAPNNTVQSQYIADAQIYLVGEGVLDDKQSAGWLVRFLDKIWPF